MNQYTIKDRDGVEMLVYADSTLATAKLAALALEESAVLNESTIQTDEV